MPCAGGAVPYARTMGCPWCLTPCIGGALGGGKPRACRRPSILSIGGVESDGLGKRLCLEFLELILVNRTGVEKRLRGGNLVGRRLPGHFPDIGVGVGLWPLHGGPLPIRHAAPAHD